MDIEEKDTTVRCECGVPHLIEYEKVHAVAEKDQMTQFSQTKKHIPTRNLKSVF